MGDANDAQPTLLRPAFRPSDSEIYAFELEVVEGPDTGAVLRVDADRATRALLGQSESCDLRLKDREVSRRHAAFVVVGDELWVEDAGSTNGVYAQNVRVGSARLVGGEQLRVGASLLTVRRVAAKAPPSLPVAGRFGRVVGASTEMRRIYELCHRLANASVPVVVEGETGTGKEVMAEALHEQGARAAGPFVVFDCTSVAPSLVEAELFGHERGAFTGAVGARRGVFEQAHGGSLLIDEIGDLDLSLQPKLLRAIERGEVRRVGGDRPIKVDVRVLAATRRDLDREVAGGRFRDDLYHRLAVARVELPPLRHRQGDVPVLVRHFLGQLGAPEAAIPPDVLQRWSLDAWPGNVRELRNAVSRRVALGELAERASRPEGAANAGLEGLFEQPYTVARDRVLADFEKRYVQHLLALHQGNVARAAEASGIARRYFQIIKARSS
jgi:DNA-binding NtrC family response regulator